MATALRFCCLFALYLMVVTMEAPRDQSATSPRHLFTRDNPVLRISVIWHVLTNDTASYVSRDVILQNMIYLNDWFSAKNRRYTDTDAFSAVVARGDDLKIRFELASFDPSGNATDGVRYVNTPKAQNCSKKSNDFSIFTSALGGDDIWDSGRYLNIYTCRLIGSKLGGGISSSPSKKPTRSDAFLIDYNDVGAFEQDPGGLITHELGHWIGGMKHTFGNQSCFDDDGFSDTPTTDLAAVDWVPATDQCNRFDNATAFVRCNNTVMVRNVMEYNNLCWSYFTKQQAAHMRANLVNPNLARYTLNNSTGLSPFCPSDDCWLKHCGLNSCGQPCGFCPSQSVCGSDGLCRSTIPTNVRCNSAEGLAQSTTGYSISKNNTGITVRSQSCGKSKPEESRTLSNPGLLQTSVHRM
jgi:hypothetical protein